jgi:hypothetical protein
MSTMSRVVIVPILIACQLFGCSLFGSRKQILTVTSEPSGAEVSIGGMVVGTTPLQHEVERGGSVLVGVKKSGYQAQYRNSSRKLSTLGVMDVIGGWLLLLPFLGLFSNAAWEYDPETFGFVLDPEK